MYYGTARKPTEKILKASFWIPMANSLTSIYAALTVFTFLGHISFKLNLSIDEISGQGMDLAFVAYPGLLDQLAWSNFFSIIFFLMLVTLGVDSVFGNFDYYQTMISDLFPIILKTMRREYYCAILTCFCFVCSLTFTNRAGFYTFGMFDELSCGVSLLFCLLMELILVGWMFGIDKLDILLQKRTGENIPQIVKYICMGFIPIFTSIMIILNLIGEFSAAKATARDWPWWITTLGRSLFVVPICLGLFLGSCKNYGARKDIYDLIEKQYGIRFNNANYMDKTYVEVEAKGEGESHIELAAAAKENAAE